MSIYICGYIWSTKYLWVHLEYEICMTFMRTNIIILWYKYGNKNSRTVGVQTEYRFYVNHTLQLKWSTFVGTIFWSTNGVHIKCWIRVPFVGTKNKMYSNCTTSRYCAKNMPFPWLLPKALSDSKKDDHREPRGGFLWGGRPASVAI